MTPDRHSPHRWLKPTGVIALVLVLVTSLAGVGGPHDPLLGLASVVILLAQSGTLAAAYIFGGWGLGRVFWPLVKGSSSPLALQFALGLGIMLWVSHLLGVSGLLGGHHGRYVAVAVVFVGLVLLAHQLAGVFRGVQRWPSLPPVSVLAIPGLAVLLVAACNPPGVLWASEFGGYDVLSYHLQLPKEWLAGGRLVPLKHNVYSFLPSYLEAAYMHLGALMGGFFTGDGAATTACQLLHAGFGLLTAVLVGRGVAVATDRVRQSGSGFAGASAGALVLSTPWVIVVGSMAYNELGVAAMFAGAVLTAVDGKLTPLHKGILAGVLVGAACSIKPTAMFLAAPPVALLLFGLAPVRRWPRMAVAGAATGLFMLAPWLIRNWMAAGNPVFPFAAGLFGSGHWTAEQVSRYAGAHSFDGSFLDRLKLLLFVDPFDPAGPRHRGMMHPQWSIMAPLTLAAAAVAISHHPTRRIGVLLGIGVLAQLALWLFAGHLQSRFLLPVIVPASMLFGLAILAVKSLALRSQSRMTRVAVLGVPGALVLCTAAHAYQIFATQLRGDGELIGHPNYFLAGGIGVFTGSIRTDELQGLYPQIDTNRRIPPDRTIYLLGDATPFYYRGTIVYHTTWDASPLGRAIAADPDRPERWSADLTAQGIDLVLFGWPELFRLIERDRWYDPAVTMDRLRSWSRSLGRPIIVWPEADRELYDLRRAPAQRGGEGGPP